MSEIERITDLLRRQIKKKASPKAWKDFVACLPGDDDDDGPLETVSRDIVGTVFVIHYTDAKGVQSQRRILVRSLGYFGSNLAVSAWCYERDAARSFLAQRIDQMANCATGELIDKPLDYFQRISSTDPTAEALERSAPGIQILSSLAICDGHFHPDEFETILRYVDMNAVSMDTDWNIVGTFIKASWPDISTFDKAVKRLRFQGEEDVRRIITFAKNLVLADGVLQDEELELMEILMGE